jgi:REP element-mobilizing transposase RayT
VKTNWWDGSESRPYRDVIGRRALPHDPPLFVDASKEIFFITICCKKRGANQLCNPEAASVLFQATQFYQHQQRWFVPVLLLMPDHVHFLASFSRDVKMTTVLWPVGSVSHRSTPRLIGSATFLIIACAETKVGAKKATTSCRTQFGLG